jgi:hypothetical protein
MIMMPMFHINAQVMSTLSSRVANARILVTPKFSASRFWQQVADNHVTWVSVVPTIVSFLLLNEKANAAYGRLQSQINLRFVRSSSFALPEERLRAFQDRFHTLIIEGYGMTEASSQCTTNPHDAPKIGSAGLPFGTEVKILIADHFTDAPGALGEIAIKGDHVITHYLDDEKPESFKDGWFLTGDLGYFDEDGYLFVKGRKKEIISRGGEKVAPAHVESVLSELPFIEQQAVIGMPDDLYGEEVTAVLVSTTPGLNEAEQREEILAFGRSHLAKFEAPTRVEFVREFPRNTTGKILRPQLREQLLSVGAHNVNEEKKSTHHLVSRHRRCRRLVWLVFNASTSSTKLTTVTIGYQKADPVDISRARGELAKKMKAKGYKVVFKEFQDGTALTTALKSGDIDYARVGDVPPVTAQANGLDFVYVAAGSDKVQGSGIEVKKTSGITSLADLKGKTIAYTKGTSSQYMLIQALKKPAFPHLM